MTHPSLPTRNSGLRVFSAAILSALLIVMPFVQLATASQRDSRVRGRSPESVSQAKTELKTGATGATADNLFVNAPIPKPAPEPPALLAPSITATKVDSWDDTASPDGKVDPGQVITYTVTINNGGPDPALNVQFADSVDTHTTLVPGSVQTQPLAIADTASAFGNVRISTANGAVNLLANDCDPDDTTGPCNDNLTASGPVTSTQNGNVVVNADGTFEYNPFPGFNGTDSFTYTIRDRGPNNIANDSDDATDTATVTITVGPTVIWFINNSAGGGGDGRFTSPFNSIAAFNAGAADDPGDIIFIYFGTGANYTGGLTLLTNQKVIGQGFLLQTETGAPPAGSDTLPGAGSSPTIDNAGGNIITLSSGGAGTGNTLRGFNTGNSGAAGTAGTDISGTTFGTLTISNLSINGDGRALNLATGTLAATVANILASNTAANDGVTLNAVGGSLTVSTNTTITNPGGDGIDISNAPASTGYNFGTTNVSKNAAGAGVILATNNATATTSFTSLTVTTTTGFALATNSGGGVIVTTGSLSQSGAGGGAASLTSTALNLNFTSIASNGGVNGVLISGGSGTLASGTTTLQNNTAIGLSMSSSGVAANFGNTSVSSSNGDAVDLSSNTGNITFADLDMTPDSTFRGLDATGNTGTITVTSGDITTSGGATASAVFIDGPAGRTPINITFTSITTSGVGNTTNGASVSLIDASGTKFQVTGTTQVNTRAGHGVFVDNSTPTTIQFGTTNIPNVNNAGGDGIHVEDTSSAVTVSSATINNTNVITTQNDAGTDFIPDNDGDGNAIFLRGNTSGSFTLNGGTLSNCGNDCIDTRDSQNLVISAVTIQTPGIDGGAFGGNGGHGIQAINLTGTNSITNSTITDWELNDRNGMRWINHSATAATLTIHGSTFSNSANGDLGIFISGRDNANMTANIGGAGGGQQNTFSELAGFAILSNAGDNTNSTATVNLNIINNTFTNVTTKGNNAIAARNLAGGKSIIVISGNTMDGGGRTTADTAGMIDIGGDALNPGNFLHFTITNNIIRNIGDNIAGSCGGLPCTGKRGIDVFIDDNTVVGNDTAAAVDADDDVVIDGNVITNVQRNGIIFDVGSVYNGGNIAARITNNRVGIRADNTIDRVGIGVALHAAGEHAIRVENRNTSARDLNILIQNNLFYNGNGGNPGSLLNNSGMLIRAQGTATMAATVSSNTFNVNTGSTSFGINAQTTNGTTEVFCLDATLNIITAPGGGFSLAEVNGTLNIEQASAAVLTASNAGASVSIATGSPSFGVSCATPPAAFNMLRPEPREYVASVTTSEANRVTAAATTTTAVSQPSLSTVADNTVTSLTREVGTLIPTTLASATTAPTEAKSDAKNHNSASAVRNEASQVHVEAADARTHHAKTEKAEARRHESDARAHHANTARTIAVPVGGGGTVNVNIGTLPANDSVTITFQVTMDNPPNASPAQISNQGTVSGTNFASVLTNDSDTPAPNDPTVTLVDLFDSTTTLGSNNNPANQSENITFTADVVIHPSQTPTPPSLLTPTGTMTFKSDGVDIPGCVNVAMSEFALGTGRAQCITSTLTPPSHNITAVYSGDSNYDTSTSNTLAQTVIACTTNPVVTTDADSGAGSLRQAILDACNGTTINFAIDPGTGPHTITLTTGELAVARNVTINNNSGESITVSGNNASRVFNVNAGKTVNIIGLQISGASAANGAGVLNDGTLTIVNSTLFGNTATSDGGGIQNAATATSLTLINTTVSSNNANGFGGGVDVLGGTATIINSTITGNNGDNDDATGGGAGGVRQQGGTVTLHNTIVAGNNKKTGGTDTPSDIEGTVTGSNNLVGDAATSGGLTDGTNGNIVGNTGIGTIAIATVLNTMLANNGGLTATHALVASGPADEAGSNANLPTSDPFDLDGDTVTAETLPVDQRGVGYPRNADSADADTIQTVDIGSFELHPSIEDIPNQITNEDTPINFNFNIGDDTGALITGGSVTATSSNTTLVPNLNLVITDPAPPGGGARNLSITPAAEQSGTTTITITVTATNGRTATDSFDLNVAAQNDLPAITSDGGGPTASISVAENQTAVTTVTSTDVDGGPPAYSIVGGADQGAFTIHPSSGALTFNSAPDFETPTDADTNNIYLVNVQVADGNGGTDQQDLSVTVTNQNEPPVITSNGGGPTASISVAENQTAVTTVTSNDADGGPPAYSIVGGADQLAFTIHPSSGALTFNSAPDFETPTDADTNNVYLVNVQVADGNGGTDQQDLSVTVTNANDPPVITSSNSANVAENTTAVVTVTSTDQDGGTPSYSIVGGADQLKFSIDSSSGALTFTTAPDFETPTDADTNNIYVVTVEVSDGNGGTAQQTINATVTNVNEAPVNTVPGAQATALNTAIIFSSGNGNQISVADVDAGSNVIQVELSVDNGTLTLSGTTGLSFAFADGNGTSAGDGTADALMRFRGTTTDINNALNGMTFTPPNGFTGTAVLSITSNDLGNTGSGGPLTDTDTVNIQVATNITINDGKVAEPGSGGANLIFTVSLSAPAATTVSVDFVTSDGTAKDGVGEANIDYTSTNGTLVFQPGQQVRTIHVPALADGDNSEVDETMTVTLSNASLNATLVDATATGTITVANPAGTLVISEFRQFGAGPGNDPLDDFVEIYNNTNAPITVPAGGYGLFRVASTCTGETPQLIGTIPATTVIPARGHFLFTGPIANYSLKDYGGTNSAVNNALLTADLGANENFALFATADVTQISSVNRFDAVGFSPNNQNACDLLREGATLDPLTVSPTLGQHSYFRKMCDWIQGLGCTVPGVPKDTNQNSNDFWLADAEAATGRLGAPGPENLASPIRRDNANNPGSGGINVFLLDGNVAAAAHPNRTRDTTPGATPVTFGTMTLRYRVTNNTGAPVTRLRYRVVDISTAIQPAGPTADLRALGDPSTQTVSPVHDPVTCAGPTPCSVTVQGTTLEQPPTQPNGGGYNSTLSSGTVSTGTPLANGASIPIYFKLGVNKTGQFRFYIIVEALP